ncbi:MAG TPA: helix-hairpin-helix domain-containing protein [Longimicrobiales bacterium]
MTLSTDERRALGIIAALLLLACGARWLERPRPILGEVPPLDLAGLEEASRAAKPGGAPARSRAPGASGPAAPPGRAGPAPRPVRVDPNTAGPAELERLPGIGPSLAARIIEERARAPFRSVEDLKRVRGIGAALATRLADQVSLPAASDRPERPAEVPLAPAETPSRRVPESVPRERLDLNEIVSTDLQRVPGVGPVLAARLIARRDSLRRFTRWEQIDEVAGVGPAMLSRLKEWLFISP